MSDESFPKKEHLKSRKAIRRLFDNGHSIKTFPLRLQWLAHEEDPITRAGFSAPKSQFSLATERNRIKRLMRESYRRNKSVLFHEHRASGLHLMFIYVGSEEWPYRRIEQAMQKLLQTLLEKISAD